MTKVKKIVKKNHELPIQVKATIWFMVCTVLQKSISLLTTPIFTRAMSTEHYGQFTIYNSWVQIFTIFTTLRLNWTVFNKGMSKYKEDRDGYTSTMQTITLSITICLLCIYMLFRNRVNSLIELPTFIMIAMFVELAFFPAVEFWTVRKRYEYVYKPVVFRTLLMAALNAGIGLVVVFLSTEKGYARIGSVIAVNFTFGLSLFIYNLKKAGRMFVKEYAVFAIQFNLPLLIHYLSVYVLDQFDRIMIQKMVGISAAGLYGVAYSAGLLMKIVTQSLNSALVPWQYEKLGKKEFKSMDDMMFVVFSLIAVCSIVFSIMAPELMRILADSRYYEAVYVIPPVAIGMLFSFMYTTIANTEFFFDANKFTMYISVLGAVANVGLNYIGIKMFGYIAAAYTTLICYAIFALAHFIYMTHCVKKSQNVVSVFNGKRLVILGIITVILGTFVIFLYDYALLRYGILVVILIIAVANKSRLLSMWKTIKSSKGKRKKA